MSLDDVVFAVRAPVVEGSEPLLHLFLTRVGAEATSSLSNPFECCHINIAVDFSKAEGQFPLWLNTLREAPAIAIDATAPLIFSVRFFCN